MASPVILLFVVWVVHRVKEDPEDFLTTCMAMAMAATAGLSLILFILWVRQ
jgi:hypothetical protein